MSIIDSIDGLSYFTKVKRFDPTHVEWLFYTNENEVHVICDTMTGKMYWYFKVESALGFEPTTLDEVLNLNMSNGLREELLFNLDLFI